MSTGNKLAMTLVAALTFTTAVSPAASMCRHVFNDISTTAGNTNRSPSPAELEIASQIAKLKKVHQNTLTELSKPEELRRNKDPRLFSGFRNNDSNPVTVELRYKADILESDIATLNKALQTMNKTYSEINQVRAKVNSDKQLTPYQKVTLNKTLDSLTGNLENSIKDSRGSERLLEEQVAEASASIQKSLAPLMSGKGEVSSFESNRLVLDNQFKDRANTISAKSKSIMGRELKQAITQELAKISLRLKVSDEAVLARFKELDQLGEKARLRGIDDSVIALMTNLSFSHQKTSKEIFNLFHETNQLGSSTKSYFYVNDFESAALTEIALDLNIQPRQVMNKFFAFEKLGHEYKGKYSFSRINGPALIYLTRFGLSNRQFRDDDIVNHLFKVYDLSRDYQGSFRMNDLGGSILTKTALTTNQTIEVLNIRFFDTLASYKDTFKKTATDEDLAILVDIGVKYDLSPQTVIGISKSIGTMIGQPRLDPASLRSVLAIAHETDAHNFRDDTALQQALLKLNTTKQSLTDRLIDTESTGSSSDSGSYQSTWRSYGSAFGYDNY